MLVGPPVLSVSEALARTRLAGSLAGPIPTPPLPATTFTARGRGRPVIAVQQVQLFLYELFAESNKPMPPTGPKQWSFKLTPRQRQLLEGLPVAAPAEQSVRAAREAAFALFFAEIPAMAKSNDQRGPAFAELTSG